MVTIAFAVLNYFLPIFNWWWIALPIITDFIINNSGVADLSSLEKRIESLESEIEDLKNKNNKSEEYYENLGNY